MVKGNTYKQNRTLKIFLAFHGPLPFPHPPPQKKRQKHKRNTIRPLHWPNLVTPFTLSPCKKNEVISVDSLKHEDNFFSWLQKRKKNPELQEHKTLKHMTPSYPHFAFTIYSKYSFLFSKLISLSICNSVELQQCIRNSQPHSSLQTSQLVFPIM